MTTDLTQDMLILPRVQPYTKTEFDGSGAYLTLTSTGLSGSIRMQTPYAPQTGELAGQWYGSQTRFDTEGGKWTQYVGTHVVDNFGNLVALPE